VAPPMNGRRVGWRFCRSHCGNISNSIVMTLLQHITGANCFLSVHVRHGWSER
jgi:hypothetical protein